jgi:hypothetical protein
MFFQGASSSLVGPLGKVKHNNTNKLLNVQMVSRRLMCALFTLGATQLISGAVSTTTKSEKPTMACGLGTAARVVYPPRAKKATGKKIKY